MNPVGLTYFVADVHLGLDVNDPADREARFVSFLEGLPPETEALYLLGDIWDFWYEYHDVVPKGYVRVFSALLKLMDSGVKIYFFQGNHDVWTYSYLEELGLVKLRQPAFVEISGKVFCLGHGDGLGPVPNGYKLLRWIFHNRFLQALFSCLHPWIAFRIGKGWSKKNRLSHEKGYVFSGEDEPLMIFANNVMASRHVDYFIFGHYHSRIDKRIGKAEFHILKDWLSSSEYICFDGEKLTVSDTI